jgi:glutamate 5-kinase
MAGGAGSSIGKGGMLTKVLAAKRGRQRRQHRDRLGPRARRAAAPGGGRGHRHRAAGRHAKLAARKQWMADHLQLRGAVVVDEGAALKLRDEGKSLLPIGVTEVQGEFARGDVIAVRTGRAPEIARGLANYSAAEARLIARKPSAQIEALLGYANEPEMIHRDNLVLV